MNFIHSLLNFGMKPPKNVQSNSIRFYSPEARGHTPTALDKRLLVFFKRYKTVEEIPNVISLDTMHKIRNKGRMYLATFIMAATLVSCYGMVRSGKHAAEKGEYVSRQNLEWHRQIKEEAASKEQSEAART